MEDRQEIIAILRTEKIIAGDKVKVSPLIGGVSSDIWLLECEEEKYVVKQALPKLNVEDHWEANIGRNIAEQNFVKFLSSWSPANVPNLIYGDSSHAFFVMPYYSAPWRNWKSELMQGVFDSEVTSSSATLLADIHNHSLENEGIAARFANKGDFYDLRIEPYLVRTGEKTPALESLFKEEAARLMRAEMALMHGDFSPKNILINDGEILLLDHEVACFGDPAFDLAFLINHLMLKNILFINQHLISDLPGVAWQSYFQRISTKNKRELMERSSRLWLMLLLARVDGKSPVEYLDSRQKVFIRDFVHDYLPHPKAIDFIHLKERFYHALSKK